MKNDVQPKFAIGHQYTTRGKQKTLCTVTDILKTYNAKGELVKTRYVSTHMFLGQLVTDHEVPEVTLLRAEFDNSLKGVSA